MIIQRGNLDVSSISNHPANSAELAAYKTKQLTSSNVRRQGKVSSSTLPNISTPSAPSSYISTLPSRSPKIKQQSVQSIDNSPNHPITHTSLDGVENIHSPSPPSVLSPHRSPIRSHLPPVSPASPDLSGSTSSLDKEFDDFHSDSEESHSSLEGETIIVNHYKSPHNNYNNKTTLTSGSSTSNVSTIPTSVPISSVGLENLGNTCFMNSALQCLVHIKPLVKFFIDNQGRLNELINPKSPRHGVLAKAFLQLLLELSRAQEHGTHTIIRKREIIKPVAPTNFQNAVGKFAPYLLDYQQQDCQEFLRFLLDGLSEDLCRTDRDSPTKNQSSTLSRSKIRVIQTINDSRLSSSNSGTSLDPEKMLVDPNLNNKSSSISRLIKKMFKKNPKKQKKSANDLIVTSETDEFQSELSFNSTGSSVQPKINSFHYTKPLYDITELNKIHSEAEKAWNNYLKLNNSVVTDYFGGLLQNTTICLTCNTRSYAFDPFLDLSVPISKDGEVPLKDLKSASTSTSLNGIANSILGLSISNETELDKCLSKFTSEEYLVGDNIYKCEKCNQNREGIKRLSIYKYPKILIIQIKRFRYNYTSRDKINTNVKFPLNNFDISSYVSYDSPYYPHLDTILQNISDNNTQLNIISNHPTSSTSINLDDLAPPVYDLIGVCNHHGSLNGGHYVAHVDTTFGETPNGWASFNDAYVDPTVPSKATGSSAYVLFYRLKEL